MSALSHKFPSVKHRSNLLFSFSHLVTCLPLNSMLPVVVVLYNSSIFFITATFFPRHLVNNVVITLAFINFLILLFYFFLFDSEEHCTSD